MKSKKLLKREWDGNVMVFTFTNQKVLECDFNHLSEEMQSGLIEMGYKKIWDSFSSPMDADEAFRKAEKVWGNLLNNDWNAPRATISRDSVLLKAMLMIGKLDPDDIRDVFNGMTATQRKATMQRADILQAIADMAADAMKGVPESDGDKVDF